jgi:hypothetical protein
MEEYKLCEINYDLFSLESLIILDFDIIKYILHQHFALILDHYVLMDFLECFTELACNKVSSKIG